MNYAEIYQKTITPGEVFNNERSITFGRYCGMPPEKLTEAHYMNSLVESKNLIEIVDWLASTTLEKQAFAIVALYRLSADGIMLSPEIKKMIEVASSRQIKVETCKGCSISDIEVSKLIAEIQGKYAITD